MNPNLFYHLRKKMLKNLQLFELLFSKSDFTPLHKLFLCNGVKSLLLNKSSKSCRFFDIFFLKWQKRLVFIVTDVNVASRLRKIYCIKRAWNHFHHKRLQFFSLFKHQLRILWQILWKSWNTIFPVEGRWDHPLNFNQIKKAEYYETSPKHSAFPSGKSRGPATEK